MRIRPTLLATLCGLFVTSARAFETKSDRLGGRREVGREDVLSIWAQISFLSRFTNADRTRH
jgi:hypothetical protein